MIPDKAIPCIVVDDEPMAREILETHLAKIGSLEVIASCKSAEEAIHVINSKEVALVFLDINMPDISGLSLAKMIGDQTKVIFTTAHREYALEGFELQALDYLLKPISFERLFQAVSRFLESVIQKEISQQGDSSNKNFMFVRADRKMIKVEIDDIEYVESLSDYVKIYVSGRSVVTRETISHIETMLPSELFLRIHRSYIVPISRIESFTREFVEIRGKALPISRSYKNDVLKRLENAGR